jgi:hypothetical protein
MATPLNSYTSSSYAASNYSIQPNDDQTSSTSASARKTRGAANDRYLWPQGSTIKIGFVDVSEKDKALIEKNINKWAPHVNLTFEFIDDPKNADIRIEVDPAMSGGYSWIGTEAKLHPHDKAHVTIGTRGSEENTEDTIMHEWGHVLGLEHEHAHPDRKLEDPNLGREDAIKRDANHTFSPYDKDSIMHYKYKYEAGRAVDFIPNTISAKDIEFVSSLYPPLDKKSPAPNYPHPLQNPPIHPT